MSPRKQRPPKEQETLTIRETPPPAADDLVFWCEACRCRTFVKQPPSAVVARVICPTCGQNVRFRGEPTVELPPPGTVLG